MLLTAILLLLAWLAGMLGLYAGGDLTHLLLLVGLMLLLVAALKARDGAASRAHDDPGGKS
jgi:hypothetical protein